MFIGILYLLYLVITIVSLLCIFTEFDISSTKLRTAFFSILLIIVSIVFAYIPLLLQKLLFSGVSIVFMIVILFIGVFYLELYRAFNNGNDNNNNNDDDIQK